MMDTQKISNSFQSEKSFTKAFKDYQPYSDGEQNLSSNKRLYSEVFINLEMQTLRLKESLANWREIILFVHSILLWDKSWYPGAIVGGTSFIFLSLWLLDPSVLTTVSILGLTITISDYIVPYVAATIFKPDLWTATKEKTFGEFCRVLIIYKMKLETFLVDFYSMRTSRPKMYYGSTIFILALLAWIGNSLNNLFLTYILLTTLLLLPGTEHHGIIKKYSSTLRLKMAEFNILKSTQSKKEQ